MGAEKKLIVVCAGGFAREVIWLARDCGWNVDGFLVDPEYVIEKQLCGVPHLGGIEDWPKFGDAAFVIAIGSPRHRQRLAERMAQQGEPTFATLIHPSVCKSGYVSIGAGSVITAGCIVTTQVEIGRHCIVNLACSIGHDVTIGDFCTISPKVAVSGNVTLEAGVEIGTGSTLIEKLTIGSGSMVGAGGLVTKPLAAGVLAVGSPARAIRTLEPF